MNSTEQSRKPASKWMAATRPAPQSYAGAVVSYYNEGGKTRIALGGALTVHTMRDAQNMLARALRNAHPEVVFDLERLERLDTSGALLINLTLQSLLDDGRRGSVLNASSLHEKLLGYSVLPADEPEKTAVRTHLPLRLVSAFGRSVHEALQAVAEIVSFLGRFLVSQVSLLRRPGEMRWTSLVFHMEQTGLRAVPIVSLLTFLIGLVVAYMGAQQLAMFGADIFAINLLEITVLREMAVLITAIVVAGRSSSSFTAQIGAMVANEEVAALRSMGLDPGKLLVTPRVLALVITLPMLVFIADIMALLGGAFAICLTLDISFNAFLIQLENVIKMEHFMVGMVKTPFFAIFIGLIGCFQGFRATGSAESVGYLTTVSVVQSIFIVILFDALFAVFFTTIGI